ncbi:MAG: energy transducer TonB [Pseudomonadota bacterium]
MQQSMAVPYQNPPSRVPKARFIDAESPRFIVGMALGLAFSLAFFGGLHKLMTSHGPAAVSGESIATIDFVRLNKQFELETRPREKPKPEKPDKPDSTPMAMNLPQAKVEGPTTALNLPMGPMGVATDIQVGTGLSVSKNDLASDGDYLPIVKVEPVYPRRAQERGLEGFVVVSFTVTPTGAVADPVVVESEPQGVFDDAATRAVLRFKYKPRVENGKPIAVTGVQHVLTFAIEKGKKGRG